MKVVVGTVIYAIDMLAVLIYLLAFVSDPYYFKNGSMEHFKNGLLIFDIT